MEYTQLSLTLEDYQQSKEDIKNNLTGMVKSFVRIGWHLSRIDASGAYKMDGYKTIAEFAKGEYNMTPSGVSRFIKVYKTYSLPGDTPELKDQYKEFNFSQLQEMLQLPEQDHDMILPETKRENIRSLKQFNAENENNPDNLTLWQEEQKDDPVQQALVEFFKRDKELTNEIFSSKAWEQQDVNALVEIINPSGNRSFRSGRIFLMMYGVTQGLMIKEFQGEKQTMNWQEFFQIMGEIFGESIGANTYQNYFGGAEDEGTDDKGNAERGADAAGTAGNIHEPGREAEERSAGSAEERTGEHSETARADTGTAAPEAAPAEPESQGDVRGTESAPETPETGNKPEPEKSAKEEKTVIAPAQKNPDIRERQEETRTEEPERVEGEIVSESSETVPFGSRWEYLKMQGTYSAALTLAAVISETEYGQLREADFWDKWLREEVTEEGEAYEQINSK